MTKRLALNDGNRRWWTLAAMCFALFMIMLDNTVVNVALPSIKADLDASYSTLAWTVSAYTLSLGVLLITGGRLGDIYGRRKVFLIGVVLFAASSLFISFSQTAAWLIAGRATQGIGAALMMPATLSIITNTFPPEERGKALGTWAGVSALALAIGPVVGGYLVEYVSWQSIFFLNLPVAAGALAITLFATQESRDETVLPKVDFAGIATITVGLGALTLALVGPTRGAGDRPRTSACSRCPPPAWPRSRSWSGACVCRWSTSRSSGPRRSSAPRSWRSSSRSRCSRCSSSSRSTCRTSRATRRLRPGSASCRRRSASSSSRRWSGGSSIASGRGRS
jgi:MFS family permease